MGCCCSQPQIQSQSPYKVQYPPQRQQENMNPEISQNSPSKSKIDEKQVPNPQITDQNIGEVKTESCIRMKDQGKKHFKEKKYQLAEKTFLEVLKKDKFHLPNYTNLALALRGQQKFLQSIQIINQMLRLPSAKHPNPQQKVYVVKGKILKARSQTYIVKDFILSSERKNQQSIRTKKNMIQQAVQVLTQLVESPDTSEEGKKLKAEVYLVTAKKVSSSFSTSVLNEQKTNQLVNYFTKRVQSNAGKDTFHKINEYFQDQAQIIQYLEQVNKQKNKKEMEDGEDYINDPILFDTFQKPIIVQSGHTYEEASLKQHYATNGSTDPITREVFKNKNELGVQNHTLQKYISERRKKMPMEDLDQIDY